MTDTSTRALAAHGAPAAGAALTNDAVALMTYDAKKRSKLTSYLLWLFLGGLGAHRMYNGRPGTGVVILLLTLLALVTFGVTLLVTVPWMIVDAFLIPGWVTTHNTRLLAALQSGNAAAVMAMS